MGQVLAAIAASVMAGIGGVVAFLWRKLATVDALTQRVDVMADSIEDIIEKQDAMEAVQSDQKMHLIELCNDMKWVREGVEAIRHRLEK